MNRTNILVAFMDSFELNMKEMATFCCLELKTLIEYKRFQNSNFINGELSSLYFFFGVDTVKEIYDILYAMSKTEKECILIKIRNEITISN